LEEEGIVERENLGKIPILHYEGSRSEDFILAPFFSPESRSSKVRLLSERRKWLLAKVNLSSILCMLEKITNFPKDEQLLWVFPQEGNSLLAVISLKTKPGYSMETLLASMEEECSVQKAVILKSEKDVFHLILFHSLTNEPLSLKIAEKIGDSCDEEKPSSQKERDWEHLSLSDLIDDLERSGIMRIMSIDTLMLNGEPFGIRVKIFIHPMLNEGVAGCVPELIFKELRAYIFKKYGVQLVSKKVFSSEGNILEILFE